MSIEQQRWVVKDEKGRIFGPFSTDRLYKLIARAVFAGNELIATFPDGEFAPISRIPEFYDKLLEALAKEQKILSPEERQQQLTKHQEKESEDAQAFDAEAKTRIIANPSANPPPNPVLNRVVREKKKTFAAQTQQVSPQPKSEPVTSTNVPDTIDLLPQEEVTKGKNNKSVFYAIVVLIIGALAYVLLEDANKSVSPEAQVPLLYPKQKRQPISEKDAKKKLGQAVSYFYQDTFSNYYKAQALLVETLEEGYQNTEAYALLCLTHRELWPYANQDSNDLMTLSKMAQMATQRDPVGVSGATCRVVQQLLGGQYDGAKSLIDSTLNEHPDGAAFYELKSSTMASSGDYASAIGYMDKAIQLLPRWLKPKVSKAEILSRQGDAAGAAQLLREVVKQNPQHPTGQILLGETEYYSFKHVKEGVEFVRSGLSSDRMPKSIEARGWILLAIQFEREQKIQDAIKASSTAFSLDPTNISAKEIIKRLGGKESIQALGAADRELVALGEEYLKKGNHFAAQAEFKSAFEINPKNGRAAMLAGKSLWELNQSLDAIDWLKKAVSADPSLIPAYILLADYQTQRFDFKSAAENLAKAQKISPQSYQVISGSALYELRRQNFKSAAEIAQKALKLYDTDIDTHLILTQAYMGLGDNQKAYETVSRAIALESSNRHAQALYAEVLARYQGLDAAASYLKTLLDTFPHEKEFHLALGRIYLKDDRAPTAIEVLQNATQLDPRNKEAFILLGQAYQKNNELRPAVKSYLTAAGLDPADVRPVFYAGELYLQTKNFVKAKEQFEQVQKINPLYPRTNFYLGKTSLFMGQADQALQYATMEKRMNPLLADGYILAGDVYLSKADYLKAAGEYQRAASIQNTAIINIYLARSYRLAKNYELAETLLARAAKIEDGNPEIYKEQGAIFKGKGENLEAKTAFERYLLLSPNAEDRAAIEAEIKSLGGP